MGGTAAGSTSRGEEPGARLTSQSVQPASLSLDCRALAKVRRESACKDQGRRVTTNGFIRFTMSGAKQADCSDLGLSWQLVRQSMLRNASASQGHRQSVRKQLGARARRSKVECEPVGASAHLNGSSILCHDLG